VTAEPLSLRERIVFRHFYTVLATAGAVGEWGLVCWLFWPVAARLPPWAHGAGLLALAGLTRAAATVFERDPVPRLAGAVSRVVVGAALGGIVCGATFLAASVVWFGLRSVMALRVEAGLTPAGGGDPLFDPGFHTFVSLAVLGAGVAVVHGYLHGYRRLRVTHVTVPLAGLPAGAPPIRVVHLSDLHLGPLADRAAMRRVLDEIAGLDADLVCVTGDLVDNPGTDVEGWIPELDRLRARHGVYAILGNHDRHAGAERVADAVRRHTGWRLLRDEVTTVEVDGTRLHLVGVEDRPEESAASRLPGLLARVPAGEPMVLLAHRPSVFETAAAAGVPLTLVGHTHGGQVAVPGAPRLNVARFLVTRYDGGTFTRGASLLHVSRGVGTSGQRVRIGVPCEVTVVTLVTAVTARAA
jgi:predicted MPP superfamily phosphohydrolase